MTGHRSLRSSTSRNCRQDFGAGPSDSGSPRGRSYVKPEHLLRFTNETFVSRAIDCTNRWLIAAGVYASPATRPTLSRYRSGPRSAIIYANSMSVRMARHFYSNPRGHRYFRDDRQLAQF